MMTASDLCSSFKPWELQLATVNVIYEEFYLQGDLELNAGRVPVPIMNRNNDKMQAFHQVTFALCCLTSSHECLRTFP